MFENLQLNINWRLFDNVLDFHSYLNKIGNLNNASFDKKSVGHDNETISYTHLLEHVSRYC